MHGRAPVIAIADEDMERSNNEKAAAVHFMRFELDPARADDWNAGAPWTLASTLPVMAVAATPTDEQRSVLAADFS